MSNDNGKSFRKKKNSDSNIIRELAPYMNLGIQMAVTIGLGALSGWWMDTKFSTKPVFILIFSLLGIILAFFNFFRIIKNLDKINKK